MLGIKFGTLYRLGALCGAFAMLVLVAGCPGVQPVVCTTDADCDDAVFCNGAETCGEDGACVAGEAPCTAEYCDEENDVCYECIADADCDDGDLCTDDTCVDNVCDYADVDCGDNFCDPADGECVECLADTDCDDGDACTDDACTDGVCENTDVECEEGEICVEGVCELACTEDADCDDEDACTTDTCTDGICVYEDVTCDDEDLCTTDTCDPDTGCVYADVECEDGYECDAETGECVEIEEIACEEDADCDDEVDCTDDTCGEDGFCDFTDNCAEGTLCDEDSGECVECLTDDDCTVEGEVCDENNECNDPTCETESVDLTLNRDELTTGCGDDIFNAYVEFNTGAFVATLQSQDSLDGGTGDDILNVEFEHSAVKTVTPTVTDIETISITDTGTAVTTLAGTNFSGVTTINSVNSSSNVTITAMPMLVDCGLQGTTGDLLFTFDTAATTGSVDAMAVTVSGAKAGTTLGITTGAANGIESMSIDSTGSASVIDAITMTTGTTWTSLTVTGDQNLTITADLPDQVTTIDGSAMTAGNLKVGTGNGVMAVTGGAGDDQFTFSTGEFLITPTATRDTVNGGEGTDTLRLATADADNATVTVPGTNVATSIEALRITDAVAGAINTTWWGTIGTFTTEDGFGNNTSLTVASGTNVVCEDGTDSTANARSFIVSGSGTTDTMTLTLADHDFGAAALTFTGVETLNLVSNLNISGAAADGGGINVIGGALTMTNTAAVETVVVTGTEALTITGAVTADKIDASDFTHNLTMTLTAPMVASGSGSIVGGSGDDTLVGSGNADTITGGDGGDVLSGGEGNDILTGEGGQDYFHFLDTTDNIVYAGGTNTITDFTAGTDYLRFDKSNYFSSATGGGVAVTSTNYYEGAPASLGATTYEVVVVTSASYATAGAAEDAVVAGSTSGNDAVVIYYDSTQGYARMYFTTTLGTDVNIDGNTDQIMANFTNITTLAALSNFAYTDFYVAD